MCGGVPNPLARRQSRGCPVLARAGHPRGQERAWLSRRRCVRRRGRWPAAGDLGLAPRRAPPLRPRRPVDSKIQSACVDSCEVFRRAHHPNWWGSRWSLVVGRWSLVVGRWGLVVCRRIGSSNDEAPSPPPFRTCIGGLCCLAACRSCGAGRAATGFHRFWPMTSTGGS